MKHPDEQPWYLYKSTKESASVYQSSLPPGNVPVRIKDKNTGEELPIYTNTYYGIVNKGTLHTLTWVEDLPDIDQQELDILNDIHWHWFEHLDDKL